MKRDVLQQASEYTKARQRKRGWQKVITFLAAVVVFCTTYALILPAITLEGEGCGLEEHIHDESCYSQVTSVNRTELMCPAAGQAEGDVRLIVHEHDASCYDEQGELWCPLPEIRAHIHGEECYALLESGEPAAHVHTEECYALQRGALICEEEEAEGHLHSASCYAETKSLACGLEEGEEHQHEDACYETESELVCTLSEAPGHQHTDECYEWEKALTCALTGEEPADTEDAGEEPADAEEAEEEPADAEEEPAPAEEDAPADAGPDEPSTPQLVCGLEEIILHTHGEECFDAENNLVCTRPEVVEHIHSPECFQTIVEPADTETLTCELPESEGHAHDEGCYDENGLLICQEEESAGHHHSALCYGTWELICTLTEHTHSEECMTQGALSEEEQARVDEVIALIDALPSSEEIRAAMEAYDASGEEEEFNAWYEQLHRQVLSVYINYEGMEPRLQERVTNREKLLDLEWIWSAMTLAITDTVNVTAVNTHNYSATIIYHSDGGMAVRDNTSGEKDYKFWYAVRVEKENGLFVVRQVEPNDGKTSKRDVWASGTGFVLLFYPENVGASVNVNVGDVVTVSSDFWKRTSSYTGQVYGTVTFSSSVKAVKDNSGKLDIIHGADTRELIEVNLYDYNSSINTLYESDHKYPGFQQDRGSITVGSSFNRYQSFNFGNNITSDLAAGKTNVTGSGGAINATANGANSPISGAMLGTLGSDGQPALADGTSLGYLFSNSAYAAKQNSQSINGLFQYNPETGAYTFNSRENHAQFNRSSDTFTLYRQIISSNFMMYPFGNFLPFNDIVKLSAQTSTIDRAYLRTIVNSAQYKYNQGAGNEYGTLAEQLSQFIMLMDQAYGTGWKAADALNKYFALSGIPRSFDQNEELLQNLYTIDYDEPTDFYFGMEMKMNFMQPKGGITGPKNDQQMVFYFTGDDDVWVYIDGVLFLDLSGIHRHVGGEIDFVSGEVRYYDLDVSIGDVGTSPTRTVRFSDLVSTGLNSKGTFEDYSTHSFNFYYMERGAGSGVCRMNFNFPLLRQNTIAVTKELSVDEEGKRDLLGNPDFRFQIWKEDGAELFIKDGVSYDILDSAGNRITTSQTDAYGVFALKANQTAVFSGIDENSGRYFVRELLSPDAFQQYGKITVDGSSVTTGTGTEVIVGSDKFTGVNSPVKDMSDGSTTFRFDNQVTFNKLGSLTVTKRLTAYPAAREALLFRFAVTLDGTALPAGTEYTVGEETRTVSEPGIIELAPDETAVISGILAGSRFTVQETAASGEGYLVSYEGEGFTVESGEGGEWACGVIKTDSAVAVTVKNSEQGASVTLPGVKLLTNPDGAEHSFRFRLEQVTDASGSTPAEGGAVQETTVVIPQENGAEPADFQFQLVYLEKETEAPAVFYYKITEVTEENGQVRYDPTVYTAEITVTKENDILTAALTGLWKDGTKLETAERVVSFTNTLVSSLTVEKQVRGEAAPEVKFGFDVTLHQDGTPLKGSFSTVKITAEGGSEQTAVVFDENGSARISLGHGERLKICGIPQGTAWTVTETDAGGYSVSYQINSDGETEGSVAAGTIPAAGDTVVFTNAAFYALPSTGGSGTGLYTMGGLLLLAVGCFLLYVRSMRGKGEGPSS